MKLFADRLKRAVKNSDMNQAELADKIGVDRTSISHWQRGKHTPNPEQIQKLAKALGVTSDYLLGLEKETWFFELPEELRDFIKGEILSGNDYLEVASYAKQKKLGHKVIKEVADAVSGGGSKHF